MIIANYEDLLSHGQVEVRRAALQITEAVLGSLNADERLGRLVRRDGNNLWIEDRKYELDTIGRIYLLGIGKGAPAVLAALHRIVGDRITRGLLVVKQGDPYETLSGVEVVESSHPVPSAASIRAAEKVLELAKEAGPDDLILSVVTGGASSLVWLPPEGLSLEDVITVSDLLLKSGAGIGEINIVRRHLCQLKGGRLLSHMHPAENVTFSFVTVPPRIVPWPDLCLPDASTFQDAVTMLQAYGVWQDVPPAVQRYLERGCAGLESETLKELGPIKTRLYSIADPIALCEIGARAARDLGYKPIILTRYMEGEARDTGMAMAGIATEIQLYHQPWEPPCVLLIGGEATVTVQGSGVGGPNQEFALGFAKGLGVMDDVACVAVDTDGNDGSTPIAGGIVDGLTMARAAERGINITAGLRSHNSSRVLEQLGDAVITGPTGMNILDFKVIVIGKPAR